MKDIWNNPGSSKYDVRSRFDWDAQEKLILKEKPDLLFVNQVELVSNYRALLTTMGLDTKIAAYLHYLPIMLINKNKIIWDPSLDHRHLAETFLWKTFSAMKTADDFFVTSRFAQNMLIRAARLYNMRIAKGRVRILPCPADTMFISSEKAVFKGTGHVLYNSRLYKQYGTEFFIKLIKEFRGEDLTFVVTDFFNKRNRKRIRLEQNVDYYRKILQSIPNVRIRTDGDIRDIYKNEIVFQSDLVIGPYRLNANWSMGAMDCMGVGIPAVCPDVASFPEFVPRHLLFKTKEEAVGLIRRLLHDRTFWNMSSEVCRKRALKFTPDIIVKRFLKYIKHANG